MKKQYLLALCFFLAEFCCYAQSDSSTIIHSRFSVWINPPQILTGQYTVSCGLRFFRNNWIELGGGYRYIPVSIIKKLPGQPQNKILEGFAAPQYGLGYSGFLATLAFTHYYHGKKFNGIYVETFYHRFSHPPDCYYQPTGDNNSIHYTYSSTKNVYGGKIILLYSKKTKYHVVYQWYVGGGLHLLYGESTKYEHEHGPCYGCTYPCVSIDEIHDPDIITTVEPFFYPYVVPQLGIRFGFQ